MGETTQVVSQGFGLYQSVLAWVTPLPPPSLGRHVNQIDSLGEDTASRLLDRLWKYTGIASETGHLSAVKSLLKPAKTVRSVEELCMPVTLLKVHSCCRCCAP